MTGRACNGLIWQDFKTGVYSATIVYLPASSRQSREIGESFMYSIDNMGIGLRG